jgi:hypothetical protein
MTGEASASPNHRESKSVHERPSESVYEIGSSLDLNALADPYRAFRPPLLPGQDDALEPRLLAMESRKVGRPRAHCGAPPVGLPACRTVRVDRLRVLGNDFRNYGKHGGLMAA